MMKNDALKMMELSLSFLLILDSYGDVANYLSKHY